MKWNSGVGDLFKVRLGKCFTDYGQKINKLFDRVTRYFDLMDALKMYPIQGGL